MKHAYIFILIVLLLASSSLAIERTVEACDRGTERVNEVVAICDDAGEIKFVIKSIAELQRVGEKPTQEGFITYLYEAPNQGQNKLVSLIFTLPVSTRPLELPLASFSANLADGKRLMLTLNGEYYLLSHPAGERFVVANLRLKHIPRGTTYTPSPYAGTSYYLFQNLAEAGNRQMAIAIVGDKLVITSLNPGETPAAYTVQGNLLEQFEIPFTLSSPVNITFPSLGQVTLCRRDNPADRQQALVCINDEDGITLRVNQLTPMEWNRQRYVFLYENTDGGKQVSIFNGPLYNLSRNDLTFDYNNFINSMIAGRRAAVEFNGNFYLLKHQESEEGFSLRQITLTAYQNAGTTAVEAVGSEDAVEFPTLDGGKIFLKRNYGDPPPPFDISGRRQEQLAPVNLENELFTSFSSTGAISLLQENQPIPIRASGQDNTLYEPEFKITVGNDLLTLVKGIPQERGTTLLHYHSASIRGAVPIKTVSLYRFYSLEEGAQTRSFDDTFIRNLTSGKELALKFGSTYYLLGHRGNPRELQFYNPSSLTLRSLNGTETYEVQVDPATSIASFTVPEGVLEVEVNNADRIITFRGKTGAEVLSSVSFEDRDFVIELTPQNRVLVSGSTLRLCFLTVYGTLPSARVCDDTGALQRQRIILTEEAPVVLTTIGGKQYLLESNLQTGAGKRVYIRKVLLLNPASSFRNNDWFSFVNKIISNNKPAFNISGTFYLPYASNTLLDSFGFGLYPAGEIEDLTVEEVTPITFRGGVGLYDIPVKINQQETGDEQVPVRVDITIPSYSYVPDNGDALVLNATTARGATKTFVTIPLGDKTYSLTASPRGTGLIRLILKENEEGVETILFNRNFAVGDARTLTLNGARVEIRVAERAANTALITITRVG